MSSEDTPMKEFLVKLSLHNNLLVCRRRQLGFSQDKMAKKIGISKATYGQFEGLKKYPKRVGKDWSASAWKIATYFKLTPKELFPEVFSAVQKPRVEKELSSTQALSYRGHNQMLLEQLAPDERLERIEAKKKIQQILSRELTQREYYIVEGLMGFVSEPKTLEDIGAEWGVTRERVRQIFAKGMRKLRRLRVAKKLREIGEAIGALHPDGPSAVATSSLDQAVKAPLLAKFKGELYRIEQPKSPEQMLRLRVIDELLRDLMKIEDIS